MSSKSKNKGNGAERELCKYFSDIFGGSFTRVPNSGAFTGGRNAFRRKGLSETQNRINRGDIIPPDHMPKFVIESKFYADFRFHQLLQPGPTPQLDAWIAQCMDAIDEGDLWFVCYKINSRGWFICVPETANSNFVFSNYAVYNCTHGQFRITDLKDFIGKNRDEILRLSAAV